MTTEQELKDKCAPEFIKWMCELAEGFDYEECMYMSPPFKMDASFPLAIHRAVEGWNKNQNKNCGNYFININCENVFTESGRDVYSLSGVEETLYQPIKDYAYLDYQPQSLTHAECACLDCLIDILEEVM